MDYARSVRVDVDRPRQASSNQSNQADETTQPATGEDRGEDRGRRSVALPQFETGDDGGPIRQTHRLNQVFKPLPTGLHPVAVAAFLQPDLFQRRQRTPVEWRGAMAATLTRRSPLRPVRRVTARLSGPPPTAELGALRMRDDEIPGHLDR